MAARNEHKRQKQLAKKNKRAGEVRRELQKNRNLSLAEVVQRACRFPILKCYLHGDNEELDSGLASFVLLRQTENHQVVAFGLLVDLLCLGVKDAYIMRNIDPSRFEDGSGAFQSIRPSYALKCTLGAVEFARRYGFAPHPVYELAIKGFSGVDPAECETEFEYGRNGVACYIPGPHEDEMEQYRILSQLASCDHGFVADPNSQVVISRFSLEDGLPEDGLLEDEWDDEDDEDSISEGETSMEFQGPHFSNPSKSMAIEGKVISKSPLEEIERKF